VQSAWVSVTLACASIPGRDRADRLGKEMSVLARLSRRRFQRAAADRCDSTADGP
jgi:hypothetical protein